MAEPTEQTLPSKCRQCDKPMSSPVVCDFCHALYPRAAATEDYFTLLGLPRRFDLAPDELHRKFVALSRHAHPDFHDADSPEVQQLHLRVSAMVNDAYRTLKDPASRASYLLELLGGKSSADSKAVPEGFLGTMMMMQEEIEEARASGDEQELSCVQQVLKTQRDGLLKRIAGLFDEYQEAVGCEAVRNDLLDEVRRQVNAVSYVKKLLSLTQ